MADPRDVEKGVRSLLDELPPEGLGDVVARVTKRLGIKECSGCKARRRWLNRKVPFRRRSRRGCRECG